MSAHSTPAGMLAASGRTSLLMGLGVLTKLTVDLVVIAGFGLTATTDAFFVAYGLLILVEALLFPACQAGLVPVFVRAAQGPGGAWPVFNSLFTLAVLASLPLAGAAVLASGGLTTLLAPGLAAETQALTARLAALILVGLLLVGPIGVLRAWLNAHGRFSAPAAHELLRGATVLIVVAVSFVVSGAHQIEAVAIGLAAATLVQFLVLGGVAIVCIGLQYRPAVDLRLLRSAGVGPMVGAPLLDHAIGQGGLIAERLIGSFLPAGSISAISYGHRLVSVIGNTLFTGVEVVALARLSASLAAGAARLSEARALLVAGIRLVLILGLPVALAVWVLKEPLVQLIFGRSDGSATLEAALVIGIYALGVPGYGYLLLARSCLFASGRPLLPVALAVAQLLGLVLTALLLVPGIGATGVAWAFNVGQVLACGLAALMLGRLTGAGALRDLTPLALKVLTAALVMAGAMTALYSVTVATVGTTGPGLVLALALASTAGGGLLLGVLGGLRVAEVLLVRDALGRVLTRARSPQSPAFDERSCTDA